MTCAVVTVVLAGPGAWTTVGAQQSQEETTGSKVRVGTFDSRALALAYYRSEAFKRLELGAEYDQAKAAGDEKRLEEIKAETSLMHKQVFSTWPVDNILARIKDEIPEISRQADVEVIVSKWDLVYQRSGVEFVNVTDLMVKPFDPDEETLRIIKEMQEQDPIPLEELGDPWAESN
jgi:hypothetical protein